VLHSSSKKYNLPWHRVINSKGKIALKSQDGIEYQKILLEKEGLEFVENNMLDLKKHQWEIDSIENI
jgi:methylated-DNA-protein-cysteine methyltransferase-like protein